MTSYNNSNNTGSNTTDTRQGNSNNGNKFYNSLPNPGVKSNPANSGVNSGIENSDTSQNHTPRNASDSSRSKPANEKKHDIKKFVLDNHITRSTHKPPQRDDIGNKKPLESYDQKAPEYDSIDTLKEDLVNYMTNNCQGKQVLYKYYPTKEQYVIIISYIFDEIIYSLLRLYNEYAPVQNMLNIKHIQQLYDIINYIYNDNFLLYDYLNSVSKTSDYKLKTISDNLFTESVENGTIIFITRDYRGSNRDKNLLDNPKTDASPLYPVILNKDKISLIFIINCKFFETNFYKDLKNEANVKTNSVLKEFDDYSLMVFSQIIKYMSSRKMLPEIVSEDKFADISSGKNSEEEQCFDKYKKIKSAQKKSYSGRRNHTNGRKHTPRRTGHFGGNRINKSKSKRKIKRKIKRKSKKQYTKIKKTRTKK